jgi:hypothetical protein
MTITACDYLAWEHCTNRCSPNFMKECPYFKTEFCDEKNCEFKVIIGCIKNV